ncbi:hypothetical protein OKW34_004981 [Paraburkholderia youngii]
MPQCLTMRCRSLSDCASSWCSQCTSSIYGLPRSLENAVADSMLLKSVAPSLPNNAWREMDMMTLQVKMFVAESAALPWHPAHRAQVSEKACWPH